MSRKSEKLEKKIAALKAEADKIGGKKAVKKVSKKSKKKAAATAKVEVTRLSKKGFRAFKKESTSKLKTFYKKSNLKKVDALIEADLEVLGREFKASTLATASSYKYRRQSAAVTKAVESIAALDSLNYFKLKEELDVQAAVLASEPKWATRKITKQRGVLLTKFADLEAKVNSVYSKAGIVAKLNTRKSEIKSRVDGYKLARFLG